LVITLNFYITFDKENEVLKQVV